MMPLSRHLMKLKDASLHPPALAADDDAAEIPWVLLEKKAYIANYSNDTTAYAKSKCGKQIQVTFVANRPPRVSYLCVFCSRPTEMIPLEPEIFATDGNLVLLRIIVSPEKDMAAGADLYIYRPAGGSGPSLTRLDRPPGDSLFHHTQIGLLSCHTNRDDDHRGSGRRSFLRAHSAHEHYVVAALLDDRQNKPGCGRFVLYLYSSKKQTWCTVPVSVEAQQFQRYQQEGYFLHVNTKVIAIGGTSGTIGFVDLWRGILLCHAFQVEAEPWLGYVRLPQPHDQVIDADPRLSRDIAVVQGHLKYVQMQLYGKPCSNCKGQYLIHGWDCAVWTRPVPDDATFPLDDTWNRVCDMESFKMDVDSNPDFKLLPKLDQSEGVPFKRFDISQPMLSQHGDGHHSVCFMIKINHHDARAWVISVDMVNNRLQGVAEFDAKRYMHVGVAYLHSKISKYLKRATGTAGNQKRAGMPLWRTPNKKLSSAMVPMEHYVEHDEAEREGTRAVNEDGDKMILD